MGNHEAAESSKSTKKSAFRLSGTPVTHGRTASSPRERAALPDYDDLGALPEVYGEPVLYLVARDPEWFFAYWELPEPTEREATAAAALELRLFRAQGAETELLEVIPLNAEARNWYLPIPEAAVGQCCYGEIGYRLPEGEWMIAARSNRTAAPPRGLSGSHEEHFATIPFHLAFQQLAGLIEADLPEREQEPQTPLAVALSHLQEEGLSLATALRDLPQWDDEQRRLLATLLGHSPESLQGRGAQEIDALLREELKARLSSGGASSTEVWPSARWLGEAIERLATAGAGSEALMSWARRSAASESGASWFGKEQREAEHEGGYWQEWLSSWGGSSEGGSSGLHSSGSHASSWSMGKERDFFLHVNAEVIFYGGTHPAAAVEINGQPVRLQPDGTFRHHFRFPDGAGSVPIVARSPDGVETRGVLLRFERGTNRQGESSHSAQPEEVPDPLWK